MSVPNMMPGYDAIPCISICRSDCISLNHPVKQKLINHIPNQMVCTQDRGTFKIMDYHT